ncbi:MAG: phosphoglycerate dehydrogenase, partial [Alphaproteobacteria bacterium]|nr:phosphoglycerate dehydrogenase [Alphaproteobacteria bacterium]
AKKLIEYSDVGSTLGAVNFPQVQLPIGQSGTRFIHVHNNVPGVMNRINNSFSSRGLNICSQYLQTSGDVGYVVVESDGASARQQANDVLEDLKKIDGTIRARLLYGQ